MSRRERKAKERMTMPQFWSALAELRDLGWKVQVYEAGTIRLNFKSCYNFDPVAAVVHAECPENGLEKKACDCPGILGLSPESGKRIVNAANNPDSPHKRTRQKIMRALGLPKSA